MGMMDLGTDVVSAAAIPAHEIRRFESAVWSLYMLSDNPSLPVHCRAGCRLAADFAVASLKPADPRVAALVSLVIEVGGGEVAPAPDAILKLLREAGWTGTARELEATPAPLAGPPPRNLVSDRMRKEALDRILAEAERHLRDPDLLTPQKLEFGRRLDEIRKAKDEIRTKTERAWELLEALERNLYARTRETGAGD
jgi:hypothetical protein